jgi:hypothetical protein
MPTHFGHQANPPVTRCFGREVELDSKGFEVDQVTVADGRQFFIHIEPRRFFVCGAQVNST